MPKGPINAAGPTRPGAAFLRSHVTTSVTRVGPLCRAPGPPGAIVKRGGGCQDGGQRGGDPSLSG